MRKALSAVLCFLLISTGSAVVNAAEPSVSFAKSDGDIVTTDELKSFSVRAEGADSVELLANGDSVGEMTEATEGNEYVFSYSPKQLGDLKLTAVAKAGNVKSEYSASLTAVKSYVSVEYSDDYENFKSGRPFTTGGSNGAAWVPATFDEAHGTSFSIKKPAGLTKTPWVRQDITGTTGEVTVKFEYYYIHDGASLTVGDRTMISGKESFPTLFTVSGGVLKHTTSGTMVTVPNVRFEKNKWYTICDVFNPSEGTFTVSVTDENGVHGEASGTLAAAISRVDGFRFLVDINEGSNGFDNLEITRAALAPYVLEVGSGRTVDHTSETIDIRLSSGISLPDISGVPDISAVTITNEIDNVGLEKVEFAEGGSSVLKLYPKWKSDRPLEAACEYTITLAAGVTEINGVKIGLPTVYSFRTTPKALDVPYGGFEVGDDGTVKLSVSVCNDTAEQKTVILLVPVFENGILKRVVSKPCSIEPNDTQSFETDPIEIADKGKAQGFVTAADFSPISNKIYSYVKK